MRIPDLPFIDEHTTEIAAGVDDAWAELLESVDASFLRSATRHFARAVGCDQTEASGPRPLATGSTIAGFRVETAVQGSELLLAGHHRYSTYALSFHLEPIGANRTRLHAETRAAFPGVRGRAYRTLVITGGGHAVAVRRLLSGVRRRAESATRART